MSKSFGAFTFEELLNEPEDDQAPLIENLIYEQDNVMLIGKEKANKSTLALQICCCLTAGEPLFGQLNVPNAVDVVYLQAEGKKSNTKQNLKNMTKVIPCDLKRARLLYYPAIHLNREEGIQKVTAQIDAWRKPKLIVIDPLYQSMAGKIEEQESSSSMTANLRLLQSRYECAILLLHHAHRARRNESGAIVDEGDDSVFGSFVWKAFPDTVLLIQKVRGSHLDRKLSCDTQRMGNVISEVDLTLIEPEPFYLQVKETRPIDDIVLHQLNGLPLKIEEIAMNSNKSRQHVSNALWRLQHKGQVEVVNPGQKPMLWRRLLPTKTLGSNNTSR